MTQAPTQEDPAFSSAPQGLLGPTDIAALHHAHADFVWKTLQRFGVPAQDLTDMTQEVFIRVIRRIETFNGTSKITTWLFGIAMRVASNYHRSARRRREDLVEDASLHADSVGAIGEGITSQRRESPEDQAVRVQARKQLDAILEKMDLEKRAVFVMFEIEGLAGQEIADMMGVPLGTVHSRLFAARKIFTQAVESSDRVRRLR